jgi:predicted Rossmann-fold nucleotide-binding protein
VTFSLSQSLRRTQKPGDRKTIGLLNSTGYFTPFLGFIDHMVETKFLPAQHRHGIVVDADASILIARLRSHARADVPKGL